MVRPLFVRPADGWGLAGAGVIVTGAAGGIGSAVAQAFAAAGARVAAVDLAADRLDSIVAGLPGAGHLAIVADLVDVSRHAALVEDVRSRFGRLDVLAHVAAVLCRRSTVDDITEDDWDLQVDANLKTVFFLCRATAQVMTRDGTRGRLITFASNAAWTGGHEGSVAYAASKGGVVSMTRGLARTYGPRGITVNAVVPGEVNTPMLLTGLPPGKYEAMEAEIPLGHIADPDEITGLVLFLASPHAAYITGAAVNITGGMQMF
jgi:NAD(P)-dependent dehydrogenase (short-subunit alcohol dehydrogenase family)